MQGDPIPFDHHLDMVWISEDLTRALDRGGRDGIAIGFKLDKAGFADRGQDDPVRTVRDGRKDL